MNPILRRASERGFFLQALADSSYRSDFVAAMWCLGRIATSDLRDVARAMLRAGHDSASLASLAGLLLTDLPSQGRDLFERALRELGVKKPESRSAGATLALAVCSSIVAGTIDPYGGAVLLWGLYSEDPGLTELKTFVADASEIEDYPASLAPYEEDIRAAAQVLLLRGFPAGG